MLNALWVAAFAVAVIVFIIIMFVIGITVKETNHNNCNVTSKICLGLIVLLIGLSQFISYAGYQTIWSSHPDLLKQHIQDLNNKYDLYFLANEFSKDDREANSK